MDCVECGQELIGYHIVRTAAVCDGNHLMCNECNRNRGHICAKCESPTLYCDILRRDHQSMSLLIDMENQDPHKRKTGHPFLDEEADIFDAEEDVIEETVAEESDVDYLTLDEESSEVEVGFEVNAEEEVNREEGGEVDPILLQDSPRSEHCEASSLSSCQTNPIPLYQPAIPTSNEKSLNYSLCAQVYALNVPAKTTFEVPNVFKFVPLTSQQKETADSDSDENVVSEVTSCTSMESAPSHLRPAFSAVYFKNSEKPRKLPLMDFPKEYFNTLSRRDKRWDNVSCNPSVMKLDEEQLFIWRVVKQPDNEFYTLFVVTAPKGDKRIKVILEKLRVSNNFNIYDVENTDN